MRCPRCRFEADEADCYCRHCGKPLRPYMGFWYDHGGVLLLTLIVGPFSLIPLWLSRKLSVSAKLAWTVGIGVVSAYLAWSLYRSVLLFKEAFSYTFPAGF
ncbi:zinc ribbon domain-containing protein [Candidatus Avelusimicrobium facis]|uniref:zinc ribbon domain-containing protein n=1 Tax=Candidatus Avelusimicrobium facis TaxID=3416203 RepID=UPI0015B72C61